jgi:hypothetical protein
MRYAVSTSDDYLGPGTVVIRDFNSEPKGRVFAIIPRENKHEAELIAQKICDILNQLEPKK